MSDQNMPTEEQIAESNRLLKEQHNAKQQQAAPAQPVAGQREELLRRKADYIARAANIDTLIELYDANPAIGDFLTLAQTLPV